MDEPYEEGSESGGEDEVEYAAGARNKKGKRSASAQPTFPQKCFAMVSDPTIADVVSWIPDGTAFAVSKLTEFCDVVLPKYFRHSNYSSFVRQLNFYSFRKVGDSGSNCFSHPNFIRGHPELLGGIVRHKPPPAKRKSATTSNRKMQELRDDRDTLAHEMAALREELAQQREASAAAAAASHSENQALWRELQGMKDTHNVMTSAAHTLVPYLANVLQGQSSLEAALGAGCTLMSSIQQQRIAAGAPASGPRPAWMPLAQARIDEAHPDLHIPDERPVKVEPMSDVVPIDPDAFLNFDPLAPPPLPAHLDPRDPTVPVPPPLAVNPHPAVMTQLGAFAQDEGEESPKPLSVFNEHGASHGPPGLAKSVVDDDILHMLLSGGGTGGDVIRPFLRPTSPPATLGFGRAPPPPGPPLVSASGASMPQAVAEQCDEASPPKRRKLNSGEARPVVDEPPPVALPPTGFPTVLPPPSPVLSMGSPLPSPGTVLQLGGYGGLGMAEIPTALGGEPTQIQQETIIRLTKHLLHKIAGLMETNNVLGAGNLETVFKAQQLQNISQPPAAIGAYGAISPDLLRNVAEDAIPMITQAQRERPLSVLLSLIVWIGSFLGK